MPRFFNTRRSPGPSEGTSHGVVHAANARRLLIAPQFGLQLDGSLPETLEEEIDTAWSNLTAVLAEGGMGVSEIVRIVTCVIKRADLPVIARQRRMKLGPHAPVCADLVVAGFAVAACRVSFEVEAVSEEGTSIFDPFSETVSMPGARGT